MLRDNNFFFFLYICDSCLGKINRPAVWQHKVHSRECLHCKMHLRFNSKKNWRLKNHLFLIHSHQVQQLDYLDPFSAFLENHVFLSPPRLYPASRTVYYLLKPAQQYSSISVKSLIALVASDIFKYLRTLYVLFLLRLTLILSWIFSAGGLSEIHAFSDCELQLVLESSRRLPQKLRCVEPKIIEALCGIHKMG